MIYWTPQMQWSLRDMIHKKYSNYWLLSKPQTRKFESLIILKSCTLSKMFEC